MLPNTINPAEYAYLQHRENEELEIQARIQKARVLDEGHFDAALAAQTQKKLLGGSADELQGINLSAIARRTLLSRMRIQSVRTAVDDPDQSKWLQQLAKANKLARNQRGLHKTTWRDGEAFVILDFDPTAVKPWRPTERGWPRFIVHERFVGTSISWGGENGSGEGCKAHYRHDDSNQPLEMVSQRWIETIYQRGGQPETRQRMTLYIAETADGRPARIERYWVDSSGIPIPLLDAKGEYVTDWVTPDGRPLPFPVVHFRAEELRPSTKDIWGIQNGLDHMWAVLLGAGTLTAFRLLVALGWYPTTDGQPPADDDSNLLKFAPGQIIGNANAQQGASLTDISPADLRPILDTLNDMGSKAALVQMLPVQNFNSSRQIASGDALRYGEAGLVQTAETLAELWSDSWEEVFTIARRLDNMLGDGAWNEETAVQVEFANPATRAQDLLKEEVDSKLAAGVTPEQVQSDTLGYDDETIEAMSGGDAAEGEER